MAAVIENRAREVGLAVLDSSSMTLTLSQYIEPGRSYTTTLSCLEQWQPADVVVVASAQASTSLSGVNAALRHKHLAPVSRSFFDDTKAAVLLEQCATPACRLASATLEAHQKMYYLATGAAGALLHHCTQSGMVIAARSLRITYETAAQHYMSLDPSAASCLELVGTASGSRASKTSLFAHLNRTRTTAGARFLKTSILQPLRDIDSINLRLDSVQELLVSDTLAVDVAQCLGQLPKDLDRMCSNLAIRHTTRTSDPAQKIAAMVSSVILLKATLQLLPALQDAVSSAESGLLAAIAGNLARPEFADMLTRIQEVLDDDVHSTKTPLINRIQQCFAVKPGVEAFLDLSRSTFCRLTEQVHELADKYKNGDCPERITVSYTSKRGFHLTVHQPSKTKNTRGEGAQQQQTSLELPRAFIILEKRGRGSVTCTTHELNALNIRLKDAANDCMVLTEQVLSKLVSYLLGNMPLLQNLLDNIALLDMLCSLATAVSSATGQHVRPQLYSEGPLAIIQGRHPLVECLTTNGPGFQPNDTYMGSSCSCHILTGPNMSGKSTYLSQVALIVIMAQMGCYVPATFASLRPFDKLFTCLATSDSIETNASSLMVELQAMAHVTDNATADSLVLIDELGRATSTTDGVAIAWAIAEHFIGLGAATVLATHFTQLRELAALYPTCQLLNMEVDVTEDRLDFKWSISDGRHTDQQQPYKHYGLVLARTVGVPQRVLQRAAAVADVVDQRERSRTTRTDAGSSSGEARLASVAHKLECLARQHASSSGGGGAGGDWVIADALRAHLRALQQEAMLLQLPS